MLGALLVNFEKANKVSLNNLAIAPLFNSAEVFRFVRHNSILVGGFTARWQDIGVLRIPSCSF